MQSSDFAHLCLTEKNCRAWGRHMEQRAYDLEEALWALVKLRIVITPYIYVCSFDKI